MARGRLEKTKLIFDNSCRFSAVAAVFLFRGLLAAQTTGVEGTARNALTHQPLDGVHVRMYALRGQPTAPAWGAITDHDGHFSISGMPPARYGVSTQRNGFLYSDQPAFTLESGEHKTDFAFDLTPEAFISGRVTDENGDPVQNVNLKAFPASNPARQMMAAVGRMTATTNERGEYRIAGAPGKFYVTAFLPPPGLAPAEVRTDGSAPAIRASTTYPRAESRGKGTVVEAVAGRETTDIDIPLVAHRSFMLTGVVTPMLHTGWRTMVFLHGSTSPFPMINPNPDGTFAIVLPEGDYTLRAGYMGTPGLSSRLTRVSLHDGNLENVTLNLIEGEQLSGKVKVDGGGPVGKWTVRFRSDPFNLGGETENGDLDSEGAFRIKGVIPGVFRASVESLPENAYIKRILVDGSAIDGDVIDLSRGIAGTNLEVTVSLNGGQIEGKLPGAAESRVMILLATTPDDVRERRGFRVSAGGSFYKFTGLRPGKYRLVVLPTDAVELHPERSEAIFAAAPEIGIHEGDRITRDATLVQ